jgi:hypothetical protein
VNAFHVQFASPQNARHKRVGAARPLNPFAFVRLSWGEATTQQSTRLGLERCSLYCNSSATGAGILVRTSASSLEVFPRHFKEFRWPSRFSTLPRVGMSQQRSCNCASCVACTCNQHKCAVKAAKKAVLESRANAQQPMHYNPEDLQSVTARAYKAPTIEEMKAARTIASKPQWAEIQSVPPQRKFEATTTTQVRSKKE